MAQFEGNDESTCIMRVARRIASKRGRKRGATDRHQVVSRVCGWYNFS